MDGRGETGVPYAWGGAIEGRDKGKSVEVLSDAREFDNIVGNTARPNPFVAASAVGGLTCFGCRGWVDLPVGVARDDGCCGWSVGVEVVMLFKYIK